MKPKLTNGKRQLKYLEHIESKYGKFNTRKEARESGESKFEQMDGRTGSVKWCQQKKRFYREPFLTKYWKDIEWKKRGKGERDFYERQ